MGPSINNIQLKQVLLLLGSLLPLTLAWNRNSFVLLKCEHFTDKRTNKQPIKDDRRIVLEIPTHLTSNGKEKLKFDLKSNDNKIAQAHEKTCKSDMINVPLLVDQSQVNLGPLNKYPFQDQWKFVNDTYFTADSYFHYRSNFWNPNDFCIESISDENLLIKICKLNCSADLSSTNLYSNRDTTYSSSRICLPKCCGEDETLSLKDATCRKLNNTEPTYFLPFLHLPKDIWFIKETKKSSKNVDTRKKLIHPRLDNRRTWNATHGLVGGGDLNWGYLHFSRNTMNCSRYFSKGTRVADVKDGGKHAKKRYNFRIELRSGSVKVAFLTKSRKWKEYKREFCVDGVDGWEALDGKPVVQVVLLCHDDAINKVEPKMLKLGDSKVSLGVDYAYMVFAFLLGIFFLIGCIMFLLIRKELNFNGKLIFWHLSMLATWHLFTFLALVVFLSDYARVGSNAITVVSSDYAEGKRIGWACVLIGIICHWAYLAVFFLVCAMNVNVWGYSFGMGKLGSTFIGLGAPLVMIVAFEIADAVNSDPWSEAIVPDYGVESCRIASWSAGYYLHLPVLILVCLNLVYVFIWAGKTFKICYVEIDYGEEDVKSCTMSCGTPFRLFGVVLFVLTFGWILDATKWLRVYHNQNDNWFQTTLSFGGFIAPSIVLFHVYCMNEAVFGLLAEKFPSLQNVVNFFKNKDLIWTGSGLMGRIFCQDGGNDTVGEHTMLQGRRQ